MVLCCGGAWWLGPLLQGEEIGGPGPLCGVKDALQGPHLPLPAMTQGWAVREAAVKPKLSLSECGVSCQGQQGNPTGRQQLFCQLSLCHLPALKVSSSLKESSV